MTQMKNLSRRCLALALSVISSVATNATAAVAVHPNIILINADDLGYGDLGSYGATALKTPNIDGLAHGGLRFTDAHATAATCTPSRYSLLTGEYAWRKPGTGILPGDAALIIKPGQATLPAILKEAGYQTGVVGKWHLGLGDGNVNWNGDIKPGPLEVGFDYAFIMAATGDRVPCVFVENRRIVSLDPSDPIRVSYAQPFNGEPTGNAHPELLKVHPSHGHDQAIVNGISRIGYMTGGKAALWKDEDLGDTFLGKALQFIEKNQGQPFFLYYATHEPHVPRVPHPRFVGATTLGPRGDAIAQLDWSVGQILATLDRLKLAENTLVIFTSDNGPVLDDGYQDQAKEKTGTHRPTGPLRGNKYSAYEAGTRVPLLVRWPARVKPGVSDALVSQVDFLASFATLTGQTYDAATAPDSCNVLPTLLGESPAGRADLVEQGGPLALREGAWKFIPPNPGRRLNWNTETETGNEPVPQLFDLAQDLGETQNVATAQAERVQQMTVRLAAVREKPRSQRQPNIVFILADDLGYMDIGANNPKTFYETPNIDAIAKQGMRFTAGYAACPVCSPTRASIMTGKYPVRTRVTNFLVGNRAGRFLPAIMADHLALEEVTVAERLRGAGYTNFFAGKWHLGDGEFSPNAQGFGPHLTGGKQFYYPSSTTPPPDRKDDPKTTDRIADEAVRFIAANKERPFFAYLPFLAVHIPIGARADLIEKYRQKQSGAPAEQWGREEANQVRLVQNHAAYAAMLEQMDAAVGRVITALEQNGVASNTLVIFMSDNGGLSTAEGQPTSNLPLRGGKGWLYEGGIREPLFIRWPGVTQAGTVCDVPVTSTDFYPTLLDAARLPLDPEQHRDGVSLVPLLQGATDLKRAAIYWHYPHYSNQGGFPGGAIRAGDWKLIERYEDGRVQLYNLRADAGEQNDLAAGEPARVNALRQALHAWYRDTGAEFLRPKTDGPQPWRPGSTP
jgi:arylsulfatase A-like enzyme